jgi:hypothetical protein
LTIKLNQTKFDEEESMVEIKEKAKKKEFSLKVLAHQGIIKSGTEIEIVPEARLEELPDRPNLFRARIDDPSKVNEITWAENDIKYTLTGLTKKLEGDHKLKIFKHHTSFLWRIVGQSEPLSVQADRVQGVPPED